MENTSPFKILVLSITIVVAVFSILVFSGKVPWFDASSTNGPKFSGKVEIWGTLPDSKMKDYLSSFSSQAIGYTLNYTQIPANSFRQTLTQALAYGSGPDLIIANHDVLLSNENYLKVVPYASYSQNTYKSTFVDAGDVFLRDAGVIAFPVGIDPMVLFYNRDLQNQAGIATAPADWNTMLKAAEKYTKVGDVAGIFKVSILPFGSYKNYDYNKDMIMTIINQLGGQTIYKLSGQYVAGLDQNMQKSSGSYIDAVVRYMTNFSDPSLKSFTWSPRMVNALQAFTSGNLMYYPAYISDKEMILTINPKLDFDYVFMPQVPDRDSLYTSSRILGIAMLSTSHNPAAAYDALIGFGTDKNFSNSIATIAGEPSPRKDTLAGVDNTQYAETIGKSILVSKPFYDINVDASKALVDNLFQSINSNRQGITDAVHDFVNLLKRMYNISTY